jgi:hypothetical protein
MTDTAQLALKILMAGTVGTTVMTAAVLIANAISKQELNVLKILGTMLTGGAQEDGRCSGAVSVFLVGILAHYSVGYLFTGIYFWLWNNEVINTGYLTTAVLGLVTGLFGILVWRVYFSIHRRPPTVQLNVYLTCICFSHIIFALGVVALY